MIHLKENTGISEEVSQIVLPMGATMVNAAGDYVATFIVSRFIEGKDWLQKKITK